MQQKGHEYRLDVLRQLTSKGILMKVSRESIAAWLCARLFFVHTNHPGPEIRRIDEHSPVRIGQSLSYR